MLHSCETWSLILRKECRLWEFENMIPGEYLGPEGMRMGEEKTSQ